MDVLGNVTFVGADVLIVSTDVRASVSAGVRIIVRIIVSADVRASVSDGVRIIVRADDVTLMLTFVLMLYY